MAGPRDLRLAFYFATLLAGLAQAACEAPQGLTPQSGPIGQTQPELSWRPVAGASAYRVKALSRIPNGKVIASYDTVVKPAQFFPPRPLAEERAKVTVRLNAICGKEPSAETVATFDIDTAAACRLGAVQANRQDDAVRLEWQAVPGAKTYELRAHALADGRLIVSRETRAPRGALALKEAAVVSVRPECASGPGEAVYRVVAAD